MYRNIVLYLTICITICTEVSTCNRVYVHPFNLYAYNKTECEVIESQNNTHPKTIMPQSIESETQEEDRSQPVEATQKIGRFGLSETFLSSLMNILGLQGFQALQEVQASDTILLSFTNFYWSILSLYQGASGQTATSLQTLLGFEQPLDSTKCTSQVNGLKVIPTLRNIENSLYSKTGNIAVLKTACIFVSPTVPLSEKFIKDLEPSADYLYVRTVDFTDSAKAVNLINGFLNIHLPKPTKLGLMAVDETANFMYMRHLYYKGKVSKSSLIPELQPFWVEPNRNILVPMISATGIFQYKNDSVTNQKIIKIYLGGNDYLLLIQPTGENTPENIERSFKKGFTLHHGLSNRYINLTIPKLNIESSYDMKDLLSNMKMSYLLQKNADFGKLNGQHVNIGKVINSVHFELEESDESKETPVTETKKDQEPLEIKFDRPFFAALFEGTIDTLLLFGRIVNP